MGKASGRLPAEGLPDDQDRRPHEGGGRRADRRIAPRLQTDAIDLIQFHEVIRMEDPDRFFAAGGAQERCSPPRRRGRSGSSGSPATRTLSCICGCWKSQAARVPLRCGADAAQRHGRALSQLRAARPAGVEEGGHRRARHEGRWQTASFSEQTVTPVDASFIGWAPGLLRHHRESQHGHPQTGPRCCQDVPEAQTRQKGELLNRTAEAASRGAFEGFKTLTASTERPRTRPGWEADKGPG